MGNLEIKAKEYFEKYSMQEYGRLLSWHRLSKDRQLEWIEDIFSFYKFALDNIINDIQQVQDNTRHMTSFELGLKEGGTRARHEIKLKLETMLDSMYDELEEARENVLLSKSQNK